jgi:hypothetical protein
VEALDACVGPASPDRHAPCRRDPLRAVRPSPVELDGGNPARAELLPEVAPPSGPVPRGRRHIPVAICAITTPSSQISGWPTGGAVSRVDPEATAAGERKVGFDIGIAAGWPPSDPNGETHTAWVRETWEALRPHSSGVYVNFLSDEGAAGVEAAYGERLARLTVLKDRFDPTNFFRLKRGHSAELSGGGNLMAAAFRQAGRRSREGRIESRTPADRYGWGS